MVSFLRLLLNGRADARPIWLFGENLGATANNNSYYTWRHIVAHHTDEVRPFLLLERTAKNKAVLKTLPPDARRFVVWRHSPSHAWLYLHAEMAFVSLSYRDVWPDCVRFWGLTKSFKPIPRCSLIYLEHGTEGIKALGYGASYTNNTMLRFVHYNPKIAEEMVARNGFRPYQLYYGRYLPRYQELLRRADAQPKHPGKRILWFLTWREYMGKNITTYKFFFKLRQVLSSPELRDHLERTDSTLTLCLHQLCNTKCRQYMPDVEAACTDRMKIVYASQVDVMDEIAAADLLITDYSSLGFDFTFLRKPVILYAQDLVVYRRGRKFYCTDQEFQDAVLQQPDELVSQLVTGGYPALNEFFASRIELPTDEDHEHVRRGDHIERMYQEFLRLQNETYAFLGYDFSGVGGTVFATRALMEGLLEAGKRVVLYPLKRVCAGTYPPGIVNRPLMDMRDWSRLAVFKRKHIGRARDFSYLDHDRDKCNLRPYCGWALTRLMKTIRAKVVVSTRETLHFFLDDATSPWIKEKYYYFHCHAGLVDQLFPGTIERLKARTLDTALFVTDGNRRLLDEMFGYRQYRKAIVTGNALDSTRMIPETRITAVPEKSCYRVAYLLRISEERWPDVERALEFARYLKRTGCEQIKVDIYGKGDQVVKLQYLLVEEELDSFMAYRGQALNIVQVCRQHDAMVDFSRFQSFGMGYIEAVLNGRMPFCRHNEGSDEVLRDIPECFFESDEELAAKILALPEWTEERLVQNYRTVAARYSRATVVGSILNEG